MHLSAILQEDPWLFVSETEQKCACAAWASSLCPSCLTLPGACCLGVLSVLGSPGSYPHQHCYWGAPAWTRDVQGASGRNVSLQLLRHLQHQSCSADAYCQKYCDDFRSAFGGISDLFFPQRCKCEFRHTVQSDKYSFPGNQQTQTPDCQNEKRFLRRSRVQWQLRCCCCQYQAQVFDFTHPGPLIWAEHLPAFILLAIFWSEAPSGRNSFASNSNWQEAENYFPQIITQITQMTFGFMSVVEVWMFPLAFVSEFRGENS